MLNVNAEGQCWLPRRAPLAPMDLIWLVKGCFWLLWGCIWLLRGSIWLPMGSIWLLRGCFGRPLGLHMAAQRLHMGVHGAPYGCSEAAFGCRGVAFCCTGAVYGSHAADMQYMLHLAGPGWGPGREQPRLGEANQGGLVPLTDSWRWRIKTAKCINQGSRLRMLINSRLKG